MRCIFTLCAALAISASASAELPKPENLVVADIKFGDSFERVQELAKAQGYWPVLMQNYQRDGGDPESHAFQRFTKSSDPRREVLEVQYSRVSTVVVAVRREAPLDPPIDKSLVERAIVERFGKNNSNRFGEYWWRADGQLTADWSCAGGALPNLYSKKGCFLSVDYSFRTDSSKPELATSQSIYVFDWTIHNSELEVVEKSRRAKDQQELEDSKRRAVPRL